MRDAPEATGNEDDASNLDAPKIYERVCMYTHADTKCMYVIACVFLCY